MSRQVFVVVWPFALAAFVPLSCGGGTADRDGGTFGNAGAPSSDGGALGGSAGDASMGMPDASMAGSSAQGGGGGSPGGSAGAGASGGASGSGGAGGSSAAGGVPAGGAGGVGTGGVSGSSAGGAAGMGGGPPPIPCSSDLDCVASGLLCNTALGQCVECVTDAHCGADAECFDSSCKPVVSCVSSLDCVMAPFNERVCDEMAGRCRECVMNADCPGDDDCIDHRCVCGDIMVDPDNCGACGSPCPNDPTSIIPPECVAGQCLPQPPGILTDSRVLVPATTVNTKFVAPLSPSAPNRFVDVEAFQLSKYPITQGEFRRCVNAGVCDDPPIGIGLCPHSALRTLEKENWNAPVPEDVPVTCVGLDSAQQYCQWLGATLPTLEQWLAGARPQLTEHAWGDDQPSCEQNSIARHATHPGLCSDDPVEYARVGRHPQGASPVGIEDVVFAPGELTLTTPIDTTNPCEDIIGARTACLVLSGGSNFYASDIRSTIKLSAPLGEPLDSPFAYVFRCAWP